MTRITRTLAGSAFAIATSVIALVPTAAHADPNAPYAPTTTTSPAPATPPAVPTNSNGPGLGDRLDAPTENLVAPDARGGQTSAPGFGGGAAPTPPTSEPAPESDAQRYAELEAASGNAAEFRGGSAGVYIGISSGAAIVILIILLVILL